MAARQPDRQAIVAAALAYQRQTEQLQASVLRVIARLWASLGVYREPQMRRFAGDVTPIVLGGQRQMSALTAAYIARVRQLSVGGRGAPVTVNPLRVTGAAVRNGVPPAEVYERPFHLVWRQLDELPHVDGAIEQAIEAGLNRAEQLAATDLQLSKTHTAREIYSRDQNVVGYRRVLEGERSCGLCIVASTQRYHKKNLLPIHPGCDCSTAAIYGDFDPGLIIDPETLEDLHQRILQRFGVNARDARAIPQKGLPDYRDILVVHTHGEIGPVLAVRGQPFLGPEDVAA